MRRPLLLVLLFAAVITAVRAQSDTAIDNLRSISTSAAADSTRFKALIRLANQYLLRSPDSSYAICLRAQRIAGNTGVLGDPGEVEGWLGYLEEQRGNIPAAIAHYENGLAICERIKDQSGTSVILNNLAAIYKDQGKIAEALAAHERSLSIVQARKDTSSIATSLNNIGLILYDQGRIPEAMEHYTKALRFYETIGEAEGTATVLHNIAGIYKDQGDLDQALAAFQRALLLSRSLDDTYSMAGSEDNIGGVLELQGLNEEALEHYRKALALHESVDDPRGMGYSLRNIAGIELKGGDAAAALEHARNAQELLDAADDKRGSSTAMLMVGRAMEALGHTAEARGHVEKALQLGRELGYPILVRDAAELLGRSYRADGRWKEALEMQDVYATMRDSVTNTEARRSAIRQQFRYEYEKKAEALNREQQLRDIKAKEDLQAERNRRNIILLIGIGLLAFAIGLWSRLRFVRRSRAIIQRERDRSDSLLLNILPAEVAEELKAKGSSEAKEFANATILFTDFKDFTGIAERMGASELVAEIDTCFKAFDAIMEKYHIEKIKTIGDAYMAAGGLPDPMHGAPLDVVQAALDMQTFMKAHNAERDRQKKLAFEMRLGIHTGPVVAGIVGVKKFQYDIWGDTVNTASRMESNGEVGQVNISESTYMLLKDDPAFTFTPRGPVHVKGKGDLLMYFVHRR